MSSNRYIFIYAASLVFLVALVLSLVATILQPIQQKNTDNEKMKNILAAAQIEAKTKEVPAAFEKYVSKEIVINESGEVVAIFENGNFATGNIRAFDLNLRDQLNSMNKTGKAMLPLYEINYNNEALIIIPLQGRGLWGPIWGTLALKSDLNTIAGVTFGHKAETPGLGAEIETTDFTSQFVNKKIFDQNNQFVSVAVVKGGIKNNTRISIEHGVDGISGGTITSDGTSEMLYDNLKNYLPYFEKIKKDEY
jgi:Na+-transporting NADH:ubiquinone oxidoreductase subunit C